MLDDLFLNLGQSIKDMIFHLGGSVAFSHWAMRGIAAFAICTFLLLNVVLLVYFERKVSGWMQERVGPNRIGPFGLFQLIMDIMKLVSKNTYIPANVDRFVYRMVPIIVFIPSMLLFTILPMGQDMTIIHSDVGLLFYFAVAGLMTFILLMSGWASNNKYTLMGGMRATLQVISYEIPLIFSVIGIVMIVGSMDLNVIVENQIEHGWFIFRQPLAFLIFLIASTAEINRSPFDLPEGEQELVAGYQTEYSGMRFAFMYLGEYVALFAMCWLSATLFLGGWDGPFLPGWLWIYLKTYVFVFLNMWIRWTYPRIRIDHIMSLNWKFLIPLALVNMTATGFVMKLLQYFA